MKPGLEIKVDNLNNIVVKDTTVYDSESSVGKSFSSFKQSETGSVFVLEYHRNNNDSEYLSPIIVNSHQPCAEYRIKVPKDGWFTVYHIILPTKECIYSFSEAEMHGITFGYYLDLDNIYDRNRLDANGNPIKVSVKEVLEGNTNIATTQLSSKDYISILNLQKCLVNLCQQIFDNLGAFGKCFTADSDSKELIFKRDLVLMAINVIKYMSKYNMKAEAARIINQLEGCNGICTGTNNPKKISGCGCSR